MGVKRKTIWMAGALAVAVLIPVVTFFGWSAYDSHARAATVNKIVACARLHGNKDADAAFVNSEIDLGMQQTGKSWRAGTEYAALSMEKSGLRTFGVCFITQQPLFSN